MEQDWQGARVKLELQFVEKHRVRLLRERVSGVTQKYDHEMNTPQNWGLLTVALVLNQCYNIDECTSSYLFFANGLEFPLGVALHSS